jgi:hypothetical protein
MRLLLLLTAVLVLSVPAMADWDPQNPGDMEDVKMHFPQLPDPMGWDVEILSWDNTHEIADDWTCTETGPVTDIHFWTSWYIDDVDLNLIEAIVITIYDNDTFSAPHSMPGNALWTKTFGPGEYTMIPYGEGLQGWTDPHQNPPNDWVPNNHNLFQQVNIKNIEDPFEQQEGEVYWLGIYVYWNTGPHNPVGWKTADVNQYPPPHTGSHYLDDAVFRPLPPSQYPWLELIDPFSQQSVDLAFVITSSKEIPTLNEWGLIILLLLLLSVGLVAVRRRRLAKG